MLNMLGGYRLETLDAAGRIHYTVETMRRAYRDRARYLGDPDHYDVPVRRLVNPEYALGLASDIDLEQATPSRPTAGKARSEGQDTSHFSVIDRAGNRVAATLSINYPFGSGFVPPGTGVLLNDEMDDFSIKPGVPNVYGLVGGEANAIAPGKRPLSSMSPTFVEHAGGVAVLGTPGGSRIITMVLLGILDLAEGHGPESWVARPRYHHQYLPDRIEYEPGAFDAGTVEALQRKGHVLEAQTRPWGNMQAVYWNRRTGGVAAASDPRGIGRAMSR
jgi:gamma-glutamyltranspeptidase/glutathione hydrolase